MNGIIIDATGHRYMHDERGRLVDQVVVNFGVSDGGSKVKYNPNLTGRELTILRHLIWMIHDLYHGGIPENEILDKIIHPLMFQDIRFEEIFPDIAKDISEPKP